MGMGSQMGQEALNTIGSHCMKRVKKSVLLFYSPHEMYSLVTGVNDYPAFLPWCERTEVIEATETLMTVRLHLHYAGVRHAFTTRNTQVPDQSVALDLVDGPFSQLDGTWQFVPLARPGESQAQACRIDFDLRYAFNSRALEAALSPVFDRVANTFVDSFVRRAEQVYGVR
jgi:ribosome-associated toxin RatA of RatAB toxin-antitoxin module